jgi:hypothetical protein
VPLSWPAGELEQPGKAHENGAFEAHNGHLKAALKQNLILPGSRDYQDVASYQQFVDDVVAWPQRGA